MMTRKPEGSEGSPYHAVEQVQSSQADGLVLVVQTLEDQVLVGLDRLGVGLQDLGHGQQPQVLHYDHKHTDSAFWSMHLGHTTWALGYNPGMLATRCTVLI